MGKAYGDGTRGRHTSGCLVFVLVAAAALVKLLT